MQAAPQASGILAAANPADPAAAAAAAAAAGAYVDPNDRRDVLVVIKPYQVACAGVRERGMKGGLCVCVCMCVRARARERE